MCVALVFNFTLSHDFLLCCCRLKALDSYCTVINLQVPVKPLLHHLATAKVAAAMLRCIASESKSSQWNKELFPLIYAVSLPTGVLMLDRQTGVWLSHSTPKFPGEFRRNNFWPSSGDVNAQTFICVTYSYDKFKDIGMLMQFRQLLVLAGLAANGSTIVISQKQ